MKFELGITAKDKITGFKGVITGRVQYLTGCDQYLLCPPVDKEGKPGEACWYDENRIERVGKKKPICLDGPDDSGQDKKGACESAPVK